MEKSNDELLMEIGVLKRDLAALHEEYKLVVKRLEISRRNEELVKDEKFDEES